MENILENFKQWFSVYAESFTFDDPMDREMIDLKYRHTLRVCREIRCLGINLQLNERKINLSEIIALFHDVGRFEQYWRYKTFVDGRSANHSLLGLEVLDRTGILNALSKTDRSLVRVAISNHNAYSIPNNLSGEEVFFTKMIRDADKLDIMHVIIESMKNPETMNSAVSLDLPDDDRVSSGAINAVMNGVLVSLDDVQTVHDFKILQLSWVFDIYFSYTLKEMLKRSLLSDLIKMLPPTNDVKKIAEKVLSYAEEKISAPTL